MFDYQLENNQESGEAIIKTSLRGKPLLCIPQLNKGSAFTNEERHQLRLFGKLPKKVETIDEQLERVYFQLHNQPSRLSKYIFLNNLHDKNQVLFHKLVAEHIEELLPIIYTPTVSTAVKTFNKKFRQPRGLYICHDDEAYMDEILTDRTNSDVKLIVVTDGEGVLGIGDYGISAMDIPIAKLTVYTALGGINPLHTLPIMLDLGTNNQALLDDPLYLGWHHKRIEGEDYDKFIEKFVTMVKEKFPNAFLHWEDLGRENATRVLQHYRNELCTFNDDIQGTGVVALSALLAAISANKSTLDQQRIVIFGGGSAGIGIANSIYHAAIQEGLDEKTARALFWIIDRPGLLTKNAENLTDEQSPFARNDKDIAHWENTALEDVVHHVKPTILIGCSGCTGAFTKKVITSMAEQVKHPIIMPLSNPTALCEAVPEDILNWTQGQARIATGSPFADCEYAGKKRVIAQCNNALVFPALGLGVIAANARRLPDSILYMAAKTLSAHSPILENDEASLLPNIAASKAFVKEMALTIAKEIASEKLGDEVSEEEFKERIEALYWEPKYHRIVAA